MVMHDIVQKIVSIMVLKLLKYRCLICLVPLTNTYILLLVFYVKWQLKLHVGLTLQTRDKITRYKN